MRRAGAVGSSPLRLRRLLSVLLVTFALHYTPRGWFQSIHRAYVRLPALVQGIVLAAVLAVVSQVATATPAPFIYFQF